MSSLLSDDMKVKPTEALNNGAEYLGWQWRNFFIPMYASCSGRHDIGQGNVNTKSC